MIRANVKFNPPDDYEPWDLAMPSVSRRSVLYQIRPLGIGTAETECFTSYLARIASAHHLAVGYLLKQYLIPMIRAERAESGISLAASTFSQFSCVNGSNNVTADMLSVIERLTFISGIAPTTLVLWSEVLSRLELLRHSRAWCGDCYAEQAANGGPIYDPLQWTIQPVKICLRHRCLLSENCPNCSKRMLPVLVYYLPGFCSYCRAWLGTQHQELESYVKTAAIDDFEFELWTAENIGSVIAASPTLLAAPSRQNVINSIKYCGDLFMESNACLIGRLLGVSGAAARAWLLGWSIPPLKILAKLSFLTKVPLLKILTMPVDIPSHIAKCSIDVSERQPRQVRQLHRQSSMAYQKVREQMESALTETPPPSLGEVATRLGYRDANTLRIKFSELSKKITANHRTSEEYINSRQPGREVEVNYLDVESLRKTLESELDQPCPATLKGLARRFGYDRDPGIRRKCPDLARALVEKRREYQKQLLAKRISDCRRILKAALNANPPPSLRALAKKIEGWDLNSLNKHFPQECRRISARHAEYQKQRMQRAGERLKQAIHSPPQQSLTKLSKEIGYPPKTLQSNYPELCRSIIDRYKRHRDELRKKKDDCL
jgi:hypothetical protein